MLFLYCPSFRRRDVEPGKIAWNDPRRPLYPNHAEFWPGEEPEHVRFERLARKIARRRRQIAFRRFLRRLVSGRKPRSRHHADVKLPVASPCAFEQGRHLCTD